MHSVNSSCRFPDEENHRHPHFAASVRGVLRADPSALGQPHPDQHGLAARGVPGRPGAVPGSSARRALHQRPPGAGSRPARAAPAGRGRSRHHALHLRIHGARHRALRLRAGVLRRPGRGRYPGPGAVGVLADGTHGGGPARARVRQCLRRGAHRGFRRPERPEGPLRRGARVQRSAERGERGALRRRLGVQFPRHEGLFHRRGRGGVHGRRDPAAGVGRREELRHPG